MISCAQSWSIGVVTDVQYADREPEGSCRYRDALDHLAAAIREFNQRDLVAVVNLGDLVDSNEAAHVEAVGEVLVACRHPWIHLAGNHDHLGPSNGEALVAQLGIAGWGRGEVLHHAGWRLFALDSTEVSVESTPIGSPAHRGAERELQALREAAEPSGQHWNGRAAERQMADLASCLGRADRSGERVIVLNHMGAHPSAASPRHLCWNHRELRSLLAGHRSSTLHLNGHDHAGGYALDGGSGVHYLTLPAVCDSVDGRGAAAILHLSEHHIETEGWGRAPSRTLSLDPG